MYTLDFKGLSSNNHNLTHKVPHMLYLDLLCNKIGVVQ